MRSADRDAVQRTGKKQNAGAPAACRPKHAHRARTGAGPLPCGGGEQCDRVDHVVMRRGAPRSAWIVLKKDGSERMRPESAERHAQGAKDSGGEKRKTRFH